MKAAVLDQIKQPIAIKELPIPLLDVGDVLVKVKATGICHTDLHIFDGDFRFFGLNPFPLIMGHEIVGIVERIGAGVTHFSPGDRVGVHYILACGQCPYCLAGEDESCRDFMTQFSALGVSTSGGYAQYVKVPEERLVSLPPELDFVDAAPFFCAGLTVYGGFKNAHLKPGQRVGVLGIGGLGHMAIPIAKAMGAEVIAITSGESKRKLAQQLGADDVISGAGNQSGLALLELGGVDVLLTTTMDTKAVTNSMLGILPQGTLVLTGLSMEPLPIIPSLLISTQLRVIGSSIGSRQDLQDLLQLAVEHNIKPITETYPLEEVNTAHANIRANKVRFRAILLPD